LSRIFLSHSSRDIREAVALKEWLTEQNPPLANEIFLDVDRESGLQTGTRWKDALRQANARCEAVICLLSANWESSHECKVEYRTAENLNKQIFVARLAPSTGNDLTSEWQRCDLFAEGPKTRIDMGAPRRWSSPPKACFGCATGSSVPELARNHSCGRHRTTPAERRTAGGSR
jgi:hypothetical protein